MKIFTPGPLRALTVCVAWSISFFTSAFVISQDPPKPPKPPEKKTASVELQRDILREQLAEKQIQADFAACQARLWANEFTSHQQVIQTLTDEAFKRAALDKKDFDLNLDTFEFVKKEKK